MNTKRIKELHGDIRCLKFELDKALCAVRDERARACEYQRGLAATRALADDYKAKLADANRTLDNVRCVTQLASGLCHTIDSIIKP